MTCPHRRFHDVSNLFGGYWATARRCDECGEWVPWGEARETLDVRFEIMASQCADAYPESAELGISLAACVQGWFGIGDVDERSRMAQDAADLAVAIFEHEEE